MGERKPECPFNTHGSLRGRAGGWGTCRWRRTGGGAVHRERVDAGGEFVLAVEHLLVGNLLRGVRPMRPMLGPMANAPCSSGSSPHRGWKGGQSEAHVQEMLFNELKAEETE